MAWIEGTRADARNTMSTSRGATIARADERLTTATQTMSTMETILQRATTLATELANGTFDAQNRSDAAVEIKALRESAIAAANVQDNNGEYVFGGSQGGAPPFDASGAYHGDASVRTVQTSEHGMQQVTVAGNVFTAASGVDVFAALDNLAAALNSNNQAGVSNSLPALQSAVSQVASATAVIGARQQALQQAEAARQGFETTLSDTKSRTTAADPIAAASQLAQAKLAFDTASTLSADIMAALKNIA